MICVLWISIPKDVLQRSVYWTLWRAVLKLRTVKHIITRHTNALAVQVSEVEELVRYSYTSISNRVSPGLLSLSFTPKHTKINVCERSIFSSRCTKPAICIVMYLFCGGEKILIGAPWRGVLRKNAYCTVLHREERPIIGDLCPVNPVMMKK